jgi:hypothetical protein
MKAGRPASSSGGGGSVRCSTGTPTCWKNRPAQAGPPRVPAHGQDWTSVLRGDADTVSMLTLTALLSQLLVAFMVTTKPGTAALVVATGLVRGFGVKNTVPVTDWSSVLRGKSSGKSGLGRHGLLPVRSGPDDNSTKVAHLSPRGQRVRDAYAPLVRNVESGWRRGSARRRSQLSGMPWSRRCLPPTPRCPRVDRDPRPVIVLRRPSRGPVRQVAGQTNGCARALWPPMKCSPTWRRVDRTTHAVRRRVQPRSRAPGTTESQARQVRQRRPGMRRVNECYTK